MLEPKHRYHVCVVKCSCQHIISRISHYTSLCAGMDQCLRTVTYSSGFYAFTTHREWHTHTHIAWTEACDYDKPCCLLRSSPRLWGRMGRNAKETRRSQAYSSTVQAGGGGGLKWGRRRWMLLTTQLSFSPSLPLLASSQSAETPCVSAMQWSIPSVYFTFSSCSSCCLSLILLFYCFPISYFKFYIPSLSPCFYVFNVWKWKWRRTVSV